MRRVCKTCGVEKPHSEFTKHKECKFGITHKCVSCRSEYSLKYYHENTEAAAATIKKSVAKRRSEGKDVNKPIREWNKRNPEHKRFHAAQRKRHVKRATPDWLTPSDRAHIKRTYSLAQLMKSITGIDYHVDHIIPLRGENVCGLHVPLNLQVLRADLNLSKSNKN